MKGVRRAKKGDIVKVNFIGRLEDDTIFERSEDGHPTKFQIGNNSMIQGFVIDRWSGFLVNRNLVRGVAVVPK